MVKVCGCYLGVCGSYLVVYGSYLVVCGSYLGVYGSYLLVYVSYLGRYRKGDREWVPYGCTGTWKYVDTYMDGQLYGDRFYYQ